MSRKNTSDLGRSCFDALVISWYILQAFSGISQLPQGPFWGQKVRLRIFLTCICQVLWISRHLFFDDLCCFPTYFCCCCIHRVGVLERYCIEGHEGNASKKTLPDKISFLVFFLPERQVATDSVIRSRWQPTRVIAGREKSMHIDMYIYIYINELGETPLPRAIFARDPLEPNTTDPLTLGPLMHSLCSGGDVRVR